MTFTTTTVFAVGLRLAEPFEVLLARSGGAAHVRYEPAPKEDPAEGLLTVSTEHADADVEARMPTSPIDTDDGTYEGILPFGDAVASQHHAIGEQCVGFLRWRYNLGGGPEAIGGGREFTWVSQDGRRGQVPQSFDWEVSIGIPRSRLERLEFLPGERAGILDGPREPLGHVLLREAVTLVHSNPRAALVLAVSSLEVGVKTCISDVAPDTGWLLENIQSPPIDKLLRSYLPTLSKRAGSDLFPLPSEMLKEIVAANEARNQLVHRGHVAGTNPLVRPGTTSLSPERLSDLLRTTHAVLYRLDVVRGFTWATEFSHAPKVMSKVRLAPKTRETR